MHTHTHKRVHGMHTYMYAWACVYLHVRAYTHAQMQLAALFYDLHRHKGTPAGGDFSLGVCAAFFA